MKWHIPMMDFRIESGENLGQINALRVGLAMLRQTEGGSTRFWKFLSLLWTQATGKPRLGMVYDRKFVARAVR